MFSCSLLCDPPQNYGIEFCPKCFRFIYYSSQRESQRGNTLYLKCGACKQTFEKKAVDRHLLETGYPIAVQPVTSKEDIGSGDLICYLRVVTIREHMHYAIVMDIKDNDENPAEVTVVEFVPHFPLRWGRVSKCQRNIQTEIIKKCAWVFRYMPHDCLPTPQVLKNAKEFVELESSQWKYCFNRSNNTQHLASWCKSGFRMDLEKFIPSFLRQTFKTRIDLIRHCPAILHTNLGVSESYWSQLSSLNRCPSCKAHFNRSSLISANEILINLVCTQCSNDFSMRNTTSEKQKLMSKYAKYEKEEIESLDSISECDILVFRRTLYDHHSLVTGKTEHGVTVTEFFKERVFGRGTDFTIRERSISSTSSELKEAKVKRFLPLDCLQTTVVLSKMEELRIANPLYKLDLFNCQTLCTFVKTGIMSRKNEYFRRIDIDPILWRVFEIFQRNKPDAIYLKNEKE